MVAGGEATVIPVRGQPPQRGQVHPVSAACPGIVQPVLHATGRAEQPLVGAGVHDVVPHLRGGVKEVGNLVAVRWTVAIDISGMRPVAGRAAGRDQHAGRAGHDVTEQVG